MNQIPYDYTVKVTNRSKGLYLVNTVHEELGTEVHDTVQEAVIKTIPKKSKCKKTKCCLRRPCKWLKKEEKRETKEKTKEFHLLNMEPES